MENIAIFMGGQLLVNLYALYKFSNRLAIVETHIDHIITSLKTGGYYAK